MSEVPERGRPETMMIAESMANLCSGKGTRPSDIHVQEPAKTQPGDHRNDEPIDDPGVRSSHPTRSFWIIDGNGVAVAEALEAMRITRSVRVDADDRGDDDDRFRRPGLACAARSWEGTVKRRWIAAVVAALVLFLVVVLANRQPQPPAATSAAQHPATEEPASRTGKGGSAEAAEQAAEGSDEENGHKAPSDQEADGEQKGDELEAPALGIISSTLTVNQGPAP